MHEKCRWLKWNARILIYGVLIVPYMINVNQVKKMICPYKEARDKCSECEYTDECDEWEELEEE